MPHRPWPQPFSSVDIPDDDWNSAAAQWRVAQGQYDPVAPGSLDAVGLGEGFDPTSPVASARLASAEMPHDQWQKARVMQLAARDGADAVSSGGDDLGALSADAAATPASARIPSGPESDIQGANAFGHVLAGAGRAVGRFLQRQAVGSNGEPATSDNPTVRWAQDKVGSGHYTRASPADEARGRIAPYIGGVEAPKCNQFVYDALNAAGAPPGRQVGGRIPVAHDWGDPKSSIGGYAPVSGAPQPGDVVSDGEHVGIYAPLPNGRHGTISAASPWWMHGPAGFAGGVIHNDWGFRPRQNVTIWRQAPKAARP